MPGAALADPGLTTWTDNVDNWRAADADYLQRRSVMRFATVAARTTQLGAAPVPGMLSFVLSTDQLQFTDSASASANVWRTILAPQNMAISDTPTSFGLRLASDGTAALALETGRVVLGPTRVMTVDTAVRVKTGVATASLTTDATALVSDVQVKAPSAALTGALNSASIVNSGGISTASLTATGNISAASLNVSGVVNAGSVSSGVINGTNIQGTTVAGTTFVTAGNLKLSTSGVQNSLFGVNTATVAVADSIVMSGVQVVLAPTAGPARFGSTTGPYIACSVASPSDPGVGNYPEGTIWLQV